MTRFLLVLAIVLVPQAAEAVQWLKQSTAATVKVGPFVDSTDGVTAETGLTVSQADIRLSKNGGAFAQTNNATGATHDENGWYGVPLDTTDTNTLGTLKVAVAESGALPVWQEFTVVPANVYDSLVGGSDYIQTDLTQVEGTAASTSLATAENIVDEWESQSQADPTGFHVNVMEWDSATTIVDNLTTAFASSTTEPTGVPSATAPIWTQIQYLYSFGFRNKKVADITSGTGELRYYDDGDAVEFEKDVTVSSGVTTETEAGAAD